MANYASALGKIALEKTGSVAKDFAAGAKGAFMRENPGLAAASGFASTLKKYSQTNNEQVAVKEQRINNVISLEMVRQLKTMNANIANQTRLASRADARANATAMFAEEVEKEKALRDQKLLDAIKKLKDDRGSSVVKSATGSFLGSLLKDALGSKLPEIIAGTILGKELLKRIPGRTPPPQTTPQTPPGTNKPPGKVYDIKTGRQTPTPPSVPSGGGGAGTSILRGLGAAARYLGLAGLAIGAALEVPGFIQDIKKWWNGAKWGGWDEKPSEGDKPIWERNKNNVTPSDASLGLLGMNTDLPKRTSMFNNASSNRLTVRNNNPGALRNPGGKGFQKFDTPEQGMRALEHQLKLYITGKSAAAGYKKLDTIAKIIPVYAPASDNNNVQRYIQNVCSWTGFKPDKVLTINDIPALAKAITQMEGSVEAMQYFYGDNRGSAQRYGGGQGGGGGGPTSRATRGLSVIPPVSYQASIRAIDNRTLNDGASGTNTQDLHAWEEGERLTKQLYDNIAITAKNTGKTAKGVEEQNRNFRTVRGTSIAGREIKPQVDPRTKYYQDRTEALSKQFEDTTRKLINATLSKAIFPNGVPPGIARNVAEQPGFLGNRITQYLDLQKRMTPTMNRIFGKQFGGQYASIFSQAGGLILDKGANALGSMLGFDQNSPYSFSQVVGNMLTKGKGKQAKAQRKLGREQAIYSILGIPTGATTGLSFAQKMFPNLFPDGKGGLLSAGATPQQQIAGLTSSLLDMFGINKSTLGGPLGSMLGMIPGPAAQTQGGGGGLMDFLFGGARPAQDTSLYGYAPVGMNNLSKVVSYKGYQMTRGAANEMEAQAQNFEGLIADQTQVQGSFFGGLGQVFGNVGTGLAGVFSNVGTGLGQIFSGVGGGLFDGLGGILTWGFNALISIFSGMGGGTGGGGIFGNLFGGNGFFSDIGKAWSGEMSWGDALINTGAKMIGNAATMFAANAITKNIKNPYLRIGATLLTNYGLKSAGQYISSELGFGDVGSKLFGADTKLTTALKTGDFSSFNPFSTTAASSAGYNLAGEAGLNTGVNLSMNPLGGTPYNDFSSSGTPLTDYGGLDIGTTSSSFLASDAAVSSSAADLLVGGVDAITAQVLGNTGQIAASVGDAAALGIDSSVAGTSFLDSMPGVSEVLPYAAAIYQLLQGNVEAAAAHAAATYIGTAVGGPFGALIANIAVSVLGIGKKDPEPYVTYGIRVNDNNDPNNYGLTFSGRRGVPQELHNACIGLLKTLFAMIKKAQVTLRLPRLAHDYFTIHMNAEVSGGLFTIAVGDSPRIAGFGASHGQSYGRAHKDVAGGNFNDLKTPAGFAKISEPLLNEMLRDVSDKNRAIGKSSVSKLTSAELTSGVVQGLRQSPEMSSDIYGRNVYERNLQEGGLQPVTYSDGEGSYTNLVDQDQYVYNAKTGERQLELNRVIKGYNEQGEAVDVKGNLIDFNQFSGAAAFTGTSTIGVREAYEGGYVTTGDGGEFSSTSYYAPRPREVFNVKTGKYQAESDKNIVGYDKDGKPVKVGQVATAATSTTSVGTSGLSATPVPATAATALAMAENVRENIELASDSLDAISKNTENGSTVVANSGNRIDNSVTNTIVNNATRDYDTVKFGSLVSAEYSTTPMPIT